ncbi:MAG TPA: endonuclease MutS2 [Anaerolineaceae bacterium]
MDEKTLQTLEFHKILERLAGYAAFSASAELALALRPSDDLDVIIASQARTREARLLLSVNADVGIGGAHDIRPLVERAARSGVLDPVDFLAIKDTLVSGRALARTFEKKTEVYPHLAEIAVFLPPPGGLIEAISRTISDRGEIMDQASDRLAEIRRELRIAHERLLARLQKMSTDPRIVPMLQEGIITQRNGRYVLPLRAEFKGRLRSIIHDQSSSGATLFVEPLVIVEMNNRWHELQLAERDEERRILAELSTLTGKYAAELNQMVESLAQLDLALMCAKYAEDTRSAEPVLHPIQRNERKDHPGTCVRLFHARHPLLDPQKVVPVDIDLDERTFAVVITGPNTGGKTVTLKTVGLLVLMAQSGLQIPVQSGSELSVFKRVFADIGDEQSIEQSLSTFSGHITNIVHILRDARSNSLVLLDELGAGTDPQEGAALARAILTDLVERKITCLVATHYPELKTFAHATAGVINASMEFSLETLRPTYHLTIGLPGRSNALAIADRLGLPQEIIRAARATLDPADLKAEDLLNEIHHQRNLANRARKDAERTRQDVHHQRNELNRRLEQIEDERRQILEKTRKEAEAEVQALREEAEELRRQLARARQPLEALKPLQERLEELEEKVERPVARQRVMETPLRSFQPGDKVTLRSLRMDGVLTAIGESDAEVQIGNLRVRARLSDVQLRGVVEAPPVVEVKTAVATRMASMPSGTSGGLPFYPSPGMELDLRGQTAEDALDALERYLESAYLARLPFVRIIHGKGTGKLRQVVRDALRQSPHVKSFESGLDKEGGDGVTVVKLHSE